MDKYKLKPIEHKQIKKKEVRPTTPASLLAYPPDIKLRILPNMCKSAISSQLFESISTLTKWVKTQKPLTLKPTKKVGKIVDSVEQYLSSIDIAALDKSMPLVDTIEDLIYLLGAKDEKEAIGSLYQVVALLETLINRLVQVALISMLNCNRNNPELMAGMNNVGEKPVTQYFESGATAVCELANLLGKVAVIKAKSKGKEELSARVEHSKKIEPTADIEKLKKLEETNKALANELEELKSKLIEERKAFENKEEELKKAIKDLQEEEMKKTLELNTLEKHVTLSVESIQPIDIEVQQLKKEKSKTKVDLVKLESEIRKFYEEEHDKEINSLNEKIAALMMTLDKEKENFDKLQKEAVQYQELAKTKESIIDSLKSKSKTKKGNAEYDDSFEGILRMEMQKMKEGFEKKIENLNKVIAEAQTESIKKLALKDKEIQELRKVSDQLCHRLHLYSKHISPDSQ